MKTEKEENIILSLTEAEYGRLFPLANLSECAECYSDYYFDTEAFWFRKNDAAIFIREHGEIYTLVMTVDKDLMGETTVKRYKKSISAKDFVACITHGIPRDLIQDLPLMWKNNLLKHQEIIYLSYMDYEQWKISMPSGQNIFLREVDHLRNTRYELEFFCKNEQTKIDIKKFLNRNGVNGVLQKKSGYKLMIAYWRAAMYNDENNLENSIFVAFKGNLMPGVKKDQVFRIKIGIKDGAIVHKACIKYANEQLNITAIVWEEPKSYSDKAKYVIRNLYDALVKVRQSDEYNGGKYSEDDEEYKFFGITQKEYLAVRRAEREFYDIVKVINDKHLNRIIDDIIGQGLTNQEVEDKYYDGNAKKVDNELVKLRKFLESEYRRRSFIEDGQYPAFDALNPLHQQFIQSAFNLFVILGEEEYNKLDMRGGNKFWEYKYKEINPEGESDNVDEEIKKLYELNERLFGLGWI